MKSVDDLWKEFKVRHYGKQIGNISRNQIIESEMIFKMGIGVALLYMRDDVSQLSEDDAVNVLESYLKEITNYLDIRSKEFKS